MKKVSVIVPAYNAEGSLSKTIKSLLAQTYDSMEIIIVDDGSDDKTLDIAHSFAKNSKIKVLSQKNQGASIARNAGLKVATGDLVMFCDADDEFESKMIEEMVRKIEAYPDALVVCGKKVQGKDFLPQKSGLQIGDIRKHVVYSILKGAILYSPCDKIYSRKIIEENNIRFPDKVSYGEDLIFNLNYLKNINAIYYLKKALYIYNYGDGSSKKSASNIKNRDRMYEALAKFVGEKKYPVELWLIKMRWRMSVMKNRIRNWR